LSLFTLYKTSIEEKEKLSRDLEELREKLLDKDEFKTFESRAKELASLKEKKLLALGKIEEEIEALTLSYKEVHNKLRLEFITQRDKYATVQSIEELFKVSEVSQKIYHTKLESSLKLFNRLFRAKIAPFLEIYQHIQDIYMNEKFNVIVEDTKMNHLDIKLLSAGQKQILSFILITTILEFKNFIDFIFIDTPFGRLSNKSRDFIFNSYYLKFSHLTLLLTSSEYGYLKDKKIPFKEYTISKDNLGSHLGALND
jgi:DNA sulfur modification protein DndD